MGGGGGAIVGAYLLWGIATRALMRANELKDTYKLLPLPLAELSNQLNPEDCVLQSYCNVRCSDAQGKGIYPYQWMDSVEKFRNTTFPLHSDFYNSIGEVPTEEEYNKALKFFNANCDTFRAYHLFYLKSDVLILADALAKFTKMIEQVTGVWLRRCVSLLQASYMGLWKTNKIEVPHITDAAMYETCKNACKGGLNIVAKRVTKVTDCMREHILH